MKNLVKPDACLCSSSCIKFDIVNAHCKCEAVGNWISECVVSIYSPIDLCSLWLGFNMLTLIIRVCMHKSMKALAVEQTEAQIASVLAFN